MTRRAVVGGFCAGVMMMAGMSLLAADGLWISPTSGTWSDTANWAGGVVASGVSKYCRIAEIDQTQAGADDPIVITLDRDDTIRYVLSSNANIRIVGTKTLSVKPNSSGTSGSRGGFQAHTNNVCIDVQVPLKATLSGTHGIVCSPMSGSTARQAGRIIWNVPSFTATYPSSHFLHVCHGIVEVPDAAKLSFVTNAYNLWLGPGALLYRGDSFELKGLRVTADSLDEGFTSGWTAGASVLDIEKASTTISLLSADSMAGAKIGLFKAGAGTLRLKGNGDFKIGGTGGSGYDAAKIGRFPNGDGPAAGYLGFNVAEGKVVIGTKDDPTDAPNVIAPCGVVVGVRSHQASYGIQTSGELEMNNGTLTMPSNASERFYLGMYAGSPDCPTVRPRLTLNGGLIQMLDDTKGLFVGHDNGTGDSNASAELIINGGAFHVASAVNLGNSTAVRSQGNVVTVTMNGGELTVGKNFYGGNNATGSTPVRFTGTAGRLEVTDAIDMNEKNAADDGYFFDLTMGEDFTVRTPEISAKQTVGTSVTLDGTTWEQPAGKATLLTNIVTVTVGAKGVKLVTAKDGATAGNFVLAQAIGGTGDITAEGDGLVVFPTAFAASTNEGAIVAQNGGRVRGDGETLSGRPVRIAPGSGLRVAAGDVSKVGDLTLGEASATVPTRLEFSAAGDLGTLVVEGNLSVLSPVEFDLASTDDADALLTPDDGVCTALVYSASSSVDPTLFRINPALSTSKNFTAEEITIAEGPLAGKKALVCTVAPNGPAPEWSATSVGGAWTTLANWDNANYYPNVQGAAAPFRAATAAAVPVNVDEPVTVGALTFALPTDATFGYALSGSAVTIDAGETTTGPLVLVSGGTHSIASLAAPKEVTVWTTNTSSLAVSELSGAGTVTINDHLRATTNGTVSVVSTDGFTGQIVAESGTVELDDLSFVKEPADLTVGYGTLRYTGPSRGIPGLSLNSGFSQRTCVLEMMNDLLVSNMVNVAPGDYSAILKVGAGNLTIGGTDTLTLNSYSDNNSGPLKQKTVMSNGDSPDSNFRMIQCSEGTLTFGVKDDPAHAPTVVMKRAGGVGVGCAEMRDDCMVSFDNGIVTNTGAIHAGYYWPSSDASSAEKTMTFRWRGGTTYSSGLNGLYLNNTSKYTYGNADFLVEAGEANFTGNGYVSHGKVYAGCWARLLITGGRMTFGGDLYASYPGSHRGADVLIAVGPGELSVDGKFEVWNMKTPADKNVYKKQIINVWANPGGVIRYAALIRSANSVYGVGVGGGDLYGNGGVLMPHHAVTNLSTMAHIYASTNGLVVSTAELPDATPYEIAQAIASEPALVAAGVTDGGLVKKGAGTLALSAANTYTGETTVEAGVLAFADDAAIPAALVLKPGATFAKTGDWTLGKNRVFLDVGADDPELGATYELGTVTGALVSDAIRIRSTSSTGKTLKLSLSGGAVTGTVVSGAGLLILVK